MANQHFDPAVAATHYENIGHADRIDAALDDLSGAGVDVSTLRAELSHAEARIAYVSMLINDTPRHALDRTDFSNV